MPSFEKTTAGAPLAYPADFYNAQVDLVNGAMMRGLPNPEPIVSDYTGRVLIENASDIDVDEFNILGIDGVVFEPQQGLEGFKRSPILKCVKPRFTQHSRKFVVTTEPIPGPIDGENQLGWARIEGLVPCIVNVIHEDVWYVDVVPGVTPDITKLQSAAHGARIIYKEPGIGDKQALVQLTPYSTGSGVFRTPAGGIAEGFAEPCELQVWRAPHEGTGVFATVLAMTPDIAGDTLIQAKTDQEVGYLWNADTERCDP